MSHYRNEEPYKPASSDEIDLREVFSSIGRFFASIGRGILNFILAIRRASQKFAILIVAFFIVGAAVGFIYFKNTDGYYRAQMVIDSRFYTYELLESIMNNLNEQAEVEANQVLADELDLTAEQAAKIRGFEIQPLLPLEEKVNLISYIRRLQEAEQLFEEEQLDSLQDRLLLNASQYMIIAEVYDNSVLGELQKGLVDYLSSKEYVARRVQVEQENLEMLRKSIEKDEQSLAKLKQELTENFMRNPANWQAGQNTVIFGTDGEAGPDNIFEQSIELYNKKAKINRRLLLNQEVEVVSGFTPIGQPASFSLLENILLWALIGVGVAYLLILIISLNKALNRYEQKRTSGN